MTDEEILEMAVDAFCIDYDRLDARFTDFARAIERKALERAAKVCEENAKLLEGMTLPANARAALICTAINLRALIPGDTQDR